MNQSNQPKVMIDVQNLRKRYLLGRFGADTLQGTIKEWRESRKNKMLVEKKKREKNKEFLALDGVNFQIRKGEKVGIIGRNGAGKSTLLKILSRITAPTEGYVDMYGRVTSMLEVGTGFHGDMTGRENIYLNGAILGMTKAEIDAKIDDIIEFSEIGEFIDTPIKRYSSGMFVKLGFSVAFHLDSEIIIMDEVLAVGDVLFQQKCIKSLIKTSMEDDRTVLYVSHNMATVRQLCDRCIVLDQGKVVFDGDTNQAIAIYMGAKDVLPNEETFTEEHRPNDHLIRKVKQFTLEKLALKNKEQPVFRSEEEAVLELTCTAEEDLKDIGFRFELWYQDGSKVASWMAGNFTDFEKGTSRIEIRLPMEHLEGGQYHADIVVFKYEGNKAEHMIDAVYPGFTFVLEAVIDEKNYLEWNPKCWGVIRLEDFSVRKING